MTATAPPTDALPIPLPAANGVHSPPADPPEDEPCYSEDFLASLREMDWLDGELNAGRLDQYYGEYLITVDHTIIAHNVLLGPVWEAGEAYAATHGIPFERLTIYNIPSVEYPMRVS